MFIRLTESELFKALMEKYNAKFGEKAKTGENSWKITKKVMDKPVIPDAIWHRSKSARFRQN